MKRFLAALLLCMLLPAAALCETFRVTVEAVCADYNKVGDDWRFTCAVDGTERTGTPGKKQVVSLDGWTADLSRETQLYCSMLEVDPSSNDEDYAEAAVTLSDLTKTDDGYALVWELCVTEDGGRYRNHSAYWTVTWHFVPVR